MKRVFENERCPLIQIYISFIFCFGYLFNNYLLAVVGLFFVAFYTLFKERRLAIHKEYLPMLLCMSVWAISTLYSYNGTYAMKFLTYCVCIMLMFAIQPDVINRTFFLTLFLFSSVHVVFILLQAISYSFVDGIAYRILSNSQYSVAHSIYNWSGALTGITGQTGAAALYCVTCLSIIVMNAMKNKRWYLAAIFPSIALLLTQKRSFLLIGLALVIILELQQMKKNSLKQKIALLFVGALAIFMVYYVTSRYIDVSGIISKLEKGSTSNRNVLWSNMISIFNKHPVFGIGLLSTDVLFGMTGHNIYLQLLCENGIIGALPFFYLFIHALYISIKYRIDNERCTFAMYHLLFIFAYGFLGNPIYEFTHMILFFLCYDVIIRSKTQYLDSRVLV